MSGDSRTAEARGAVPGNPRRILVADDGEPERRRPNRARAGDAARKAIRGLAGLGLALGSVLTAASPAAAQSSRLPYNPVDLQAKLAKSAELERQALQVMADDPARAERLISDAYLQLQGAHSAMVINSTAVKFHDPLFDLKNNKAQQALSLLQTARDALMLRDQATAPANPVNVARSHVEQALRLTDLLATTF